MAGTPDTICIREAWNRSITKAATYRVIITLLDFSFISSSPDGSTSPPDLP